MGKVLRLTDDEAKLLASWLRKAAEWNDAEVGRLKTMGEGSTRYYIEQAARIRALADRLDD